MITIRIVPDNTKGFYDSIRRLTAASPIDVRNARVATLRELQAALAQRELSDFRFECLHRLQDEVEGEIARLVGRSPT